MAIHNIRHQHYSPFLSIISGCGQIPGEGGYPQHKRHISVTHHSCTLYQDVDESRVKMVIHNIIHISITHHSWGRWAHHMRMWMHPWRGHWSPVWIKGRRSAKSWTTRSSKMRGWRASKRRSSWSIPSTSESGGPMSWWWTSWRSKVMWGSTTSVSVTNNTLRCGPMPWQCIEFHDFLWVDSTTSVADVHSDGPLVRTYVHVNMYI